MLDITATNLRQSLFSVLEQVLKYIPARIRYKKGDLVLLSYRQYKKLMARGSGRHGSKRDSLVRGRIIKKLDESAQRELLDYMGIK